MNPFKAIARQCLKAGISWLDHREKNRPEPDPEPHPIIESIYEEAFHAGDYEVVHGYQPNPYVRGTAQHYSWWKGYKDGKAWYIASW